MRRRNGILVVLVLLVGTVAAAEPFDLPDGGVGCTTLALHAYAEIPRLFVEADPDSLLLLLERWEAACGPHELIVRVRILGAIWDGAFSEDLYGRDIGDHLDKRERELLQGAAPDSARAAFDAFTVDLAQQLLPHQRSAGLEEFFCLFYGGSTEAAWSLLESREPADEPTDEPPDTVRETVRQDPVPRGQWTLGGALGSWYPEGDLDFVGEKPLLGASAGVRLEGWFARLVGEVRPGRTERPYWVVRDGRDFLSDRYSAWLFGAEMGRYLAVNEEWELHLFGGAGLDVLRPFGGEDLYLDARHLSIGAGLRTRTSGRGGWIWGLDLRREWVEERNAAAVDLGGSAWSLRIAFERVWSR